MPAVNSEVCFDTQRVYRIMETSQGSLTVNEESGMVEKMKFSAVELQARAQAVIPIDESDSLIYIEPGENSPEQTNCRLWETGTLHDVTEEDSSIIYVSPIAVRKRRADQLGWKDCEYYHYENNSFDESVDNDMFSLDLGASNNDVNINDLLPKFHSTPTATLSPLVTSTNLLHHDGHDGLHESNPCSPCSSFFLSSQDSLIVLEDVTNPKKGRLDLETDSPSIPCQCCSQNCTSKLTESAKQDTRHFFKSKTVSEQNQFLMSSFHLMSGGSNIQRIVGGRVVCKNAFMQIFKISNKRYERNLKLFQQNPTAKVIRKPVSRKESIKVSEAKVWMTRYFDRIGDSMPHMEQIHLPHGLTKGDVYHMMKSQLLEQGLETVVSLSHFYSIWNTSFRKVVIPEVC